METDEKLISMIGTEGHEECYLFEGCYYEFNHFLNLLDDLRDQGHPRLAKKYFAQAKRVTRTWTWTKQSTAREPRGWTLVRVYND